MTDFKKFVAIGLQAAADANRRRAEIEEVMAELASQVLEATNQYVQIAIERWDPPSLNSLLKLVDPERFGSHFAIVATAIKQPSKNKEFLAKWEQSKDGYPCKITLGSDVYNCEDREGLETCLGLILQDPSVGEKLHKLMSLPMEGLLNTSPPH